MKPISKFPRILLLLLVCFFTNLFSFKAQNSTVPDKINYQAIAHSSNGQTLNNQTIDVLIGIHIQSSSGTLVYQEEHNVTTNDYGLFTLSIGDGNPSLIPFNSIGWEDQNYYLNVQVDNGFGYEDLGSQQLVTVPYAFHARTVEVDNVDDDDNDPANEYNTNVTLNGDTLQITDGGGTQSVDLSSISSSDNQNLTGATLSGTNLTIDIEDGNSTSVDLSSLQDGVDDADNDPANEFNTNVSLNGDTLQITDGGGTQSIDLSNLSGSDNQNLTGATLSGTNLTIDIENGSSTSVDLSTLQDGVDDADNDPTNELQTLSLLSGNTLYLSVSGDSVVLPSISFIAGAGIDINSGIISNTGDGDNDPNNELISNAALSPSNDFLIIDEGSGNFTSIDVSDLNNSGTDNQDLTGATLSGTNLTIDIENGSSTTVDLSTLQDGVGTDDQNLTGATLSGNNLTIGIESGTSATVDLSPLNNSGTDNQDLTGSTLNGTNLTIDIENGSSTTVDLSTLQDGVGTDDQNLTGATLSGNNLTIDIESGNSATVDLSPLNNSGTDDQNISGSSFDPTNNQLTIGIESGSSESVDLSDLDVDIIGGNGISVTGSSGTYTIENIGDTNSNDDITTSTTAGGDLSGTYPNPVVTQIQGVGVSSSTPTDGQILTYNASAGGWGPSNNNPDLDWTTSSGIVYNENDDIGIGLTNPQYKFHVNDNSGNSTLKDIAVFETNNQYSSIVTNSNNNGEGGGIFLSKYNNKIVSYQGGNYRPSAGDTTAFFGVGTPGNGTENPELGMKINGSNKSITIGADEIKIGLESDLPNGLNRIKVAANEISLIGNDDGSGNTNPTNLLIHGIMTYDDGNAQPGYVLQTNAGGEASWADPTLISVANDGDWIVNGSDMYSGISGNVGIGTNNPDDLLHIHAPTNTQVKIESSVSGLASLEIDAAVNKAAVDFYDNGTWAGTMGYSVSSDYLFWVEDGHGEILVGKDGDIGIGTTFPNSKLHLNDGSVLFDGNSGSTPVSGNGTRFMWIPEKQAIRAGYVLSNQWDDSNIGIGSTSFGQNNIASGSNSTSFGQANSATAPRSLAGGVSSVASGNGSSALGEYTSADGRAEFSVGAYPENSGNAASFDVMFEVGNGDSQTRNSAFSVFYDGSVGIGTTSPNAMLEIEADEWSTTSAQKINFKKSSSSGTMYALNVDLERDNQGYTIGVYSKVDNDGSGGSSSAFAVYGSADGSSNGAKYGVLGTTGIFSGGTRYGVYCSGNGTYTGSWTSTSDIKFKENIKNYNGALDNLMKLKSKTYNYKNNAEFSHMNFSKKLQVGFIAQEVEKIFPNLVEDGVHPGKFNDETKEEGEPISYKAMNYIGLIPVLVKSIQEQQEMIQELKSEIEELKNK